MPKYESCPSCDFYDEIDDVCTMGHMCCEESLWWPKHPISNTILMVKGVSNTREGRVGNCPRCGKLIQESKKTRYFHNEKDCGQAISWEDVNKYSKSHRQKNIK